MTEHEKTGQAYRVCLDATPNAEEYDKLSFWTDDSDVETNISGDANGNKVSLNDQLQYLSATVSGQIATFNDGGKGIITPDGMIDVYVPVGSCKVTPEEISLGDGTATIKFPSGNNGMEVRIRCWKS